MKKFLSVIIITIVCVACGQSSKKTVESVEGWNILYESSYDIQYPQDWELKTGIMSSLFFLFAPLESDTDQFRENINLVSESVAGMNMTLNKYAELSKNQLSAYYSDFSLVSSEKVDDFYNLVYSATQNQFELMFTQRFFIYNNTAYVLTFTSEKDKYQDYTETAQKIMNTFVLK